MANPVIAIEEVAASLVKLAQENRSGGPCPDRLVVNVDPTFGLGWWAQAAAVMVDYLPSDRDTFDMMSCRARMTWQELAENTIYLGVRNPNLLCAVRRLEEVGKQKVRDEMMMHRNHIECKRRRLKKPKRMARSTKVVRLVRSNHAIRVRLRLVHVPHHATGQRLQHKGYTYALAMSMRFAIGTCLFCACEDAFGTQDPGTAIGQRLVFKVMHTDSDGVVRKITSKQRGSAAARGRAKASAKLVSIG